MPNLSFFKMQGTLIEVVDKWCREHLPTKVSELENDAGYLTEATIPGANDGVLTIKRNDSSIGTFSANQSANESINITVPTDASEISYGNTTVAAALSAKENEYLLTVSGTDVNDFITKLRQAIVSNVPQGESFVCRGSWENNYSYVAFGRTTGGETTFILQLRDKVYYAYYLPNVNQYIYEINKTAL